MKFTAALIAVMAGSAAAFAPSTVSTPKATALQAGSELPGALDPVGFFDPAGFAERADANTLKRYREAELTHGRVA
jgi:hypothetical protein